MKSYMLRYNIIMRKKDYILAAVAGVITAFFILPVLKNIDVYIPYRLALFFIIPLLWLGLIFIASFLRLREKFLWLHQFGKFFIVGFLNTSIDFGILNIMSMRFGVYAGLSVAGVNPISFIVAIINSFFWNKYWTFKSQGKPRVKEIIQFILVAMVGVVINTGIVVFITGYVSPSFFLTEGRLLNLAKAAATATSLIWNFIGMKMIVFKASNNGRVLNKNAEIAET